VTREALSVYGHRDLAEGHIATPNIDAIAADGTVFTGGRAAYPSTWDAWLMINSGRFIRVTEMDNILSFEDRYSRHNNMVKVGRLAGIDRWCHSNAAAYGQMIVGPERFDTNWEDDYWEDISDEESDRGVYRGDKHILRVERFLDSLEPGEKFFISEHMADSHFPWYETELPQAELMGFPDGLSWADVDGMQHDSDHLNYLQEVTRMDWQVGQMIEDLKERDLYDDTLIIIIGDHGCQWREHGHKYYPGHLYDPALKIPLIIKMPGIDGGGFVDVPVLQMDILPTVAELAGIEHANSDVAGEMPGCSLVPFLEERASSDDYARCEERDMLLSTHYDMFGYIDDFRYKLIADRLTGTYFLFDLQEDPGEKFNLVDSHPELFQQMLEGLRQEVARNPAFVAGVVR
jgi:arylsulfatase A-like enzyme